MMHSWDPDNGTCQQCRMEKPRSTSDCPGFMATREAWFKGKRHLVVDGRLDYLDGEWISVDPQEDYENLVLEKERSYPDNICPVVTQAPPPAVRAPSFLGRLMSLFV